MRLLLLTLLLPFLYITNASIEETCKFVATTRPVIGFEFCIQSLSSDPLSKATSDPAQLAVIVTNLSITNATNIVSKIASLMHTFTNPSFKDCLSVCSEVYTDAVDQLHDAVRNINEKNYENALTFLSAALDASDNCEDAFGDEEVASPMGAEDREYGKLADIALTIIAGLS